MRNENIAIALVMVLAVGSVLYFIVQSIVTAVKTGVDFSKAVRLGDVSSRLKMNRDDEIGELACALD